MIDTGSEPKKNVAVEKNLFNIVPMEIKASENGKFSEITGGLIYQDFCTLTLPYIIYNNDSQNMCKCVFINF